MNFAPQLIKTQSIEKTILNTSLQYKVPINSIAFEVRSVKNIKQVADSKDLSVVSSFDENDIIKSNVLFAQEYELVIKMVDLSITKLMPNIVFVHNRYKTKAGLVIKVSSKLNLKRITPNHILQHFEMLAGKNKCFLRINHTQMLKDITTFHNTYLEKKLLDKDIRFKLVDFPEPKEPIPDRLEKVYSVQVNENGDKKSSIDENKVIVRYHKVKEGKYGRTYGGKIITTNTLRATHTPRFKINKESIEIVEEKEHIDFISKKKGLVVFLHNMLSIEQEMDIMKASIRNQDSLVSNLRDGVKMNIKEDSKYGDAIGTNVRIESDEINVSGNVGSGAKVKSNLINIGGQTHATSIISSKEAHIYIHKGIVKGDKIEIESLENGKVSGKYIRITNARGGKIVGEDIFIDNLYSHVDITSSKKIKVNNLIGNSNSFTLKPTPSTGVEDNEDGKGSESVDDLFDKLDVIEEEIEALEKKAKKLKVIINFNKKDVEAQKKEFQEKKNNNVNFSESMYNKIQEFNKIVMDYKQTIKEVEKKKENIKKVEEDIARLNNISKEATIEVSSAWTDGNKIAILSDSKIYAYYPEAGFKKSPISFDILKQEGLIHE